MLRGEKEKEVLNRYYKSMPETIKIHGHSVVYEQNAYEGIRHLRDDLQREEAVVFFDQAKLKGSAEFEDDHERQFTLLYKKGGFLVNGGYVLVRR
jgi:hypothetical protein